MAYVYKGTKPAALVVEDEPQPEPTTPEHDPAKCGTYAGWSQHNRTGVPRCQPCKDAATAYKRELLERHKQGPIRQFSADKCGTLAGYSRHKRHHIPVCDDCKEARAEYRANYYLGAAA